MDSTQHAAFQGVQTSPIVLVQGIPGSGKTFLAQHSAEFRCLQNRNLQVLIGSYKNVSTDHLCEEANYKPHRLIRLGTCSQSNTLLRASGARLGRPDKRLRKIERYFEFLHLTALNALIFVTTCAWSDSCPVSERELFLSVYQLVDELINGTLDKHMKELTNLIGEDFRQPTNINGVFSENGVNATRKMIDFLMIDSRHEDYLRPLWEFFQTTVSHHSDDVEFVAHIKEAMMKASPAEDSEDKENTSTEETEEELCDDEAPTDELVFDIKQEERVRKMEERDQEKDELFRLHLAMYGTGSAQEGWYSPISASPDSHLGDLTNKDNEFSLSDLEKGSYAYLASNVSSLTPAQTRNMFLQFVTEMYDAAGAISNKIQGRLYGSKIQSKFRAVGATTSYCQMRSTVVEALGVELYVGEEAGEVSEYQILCLLCALSCQLWPEHVDIDTGLADGALHVDASWPQLILLGDHQQLRPLLKAQGIQGSVFQASAFERLVNKHRTEDYDEDNAPTFFHSHLHANRRSHPSIVAPFRCVYNLEIDALVSPEERLLIPEYHTSRSAWECYHMARSINDRLGDKFKEGYTRLLQESRTMAEAYIKREQLESYSPYGPYDECIPGSKVMCEDGSFLSPIPGRVVLIDIEGIHGNETVNFWEERVGTSRKNEGSGWLSVLLFKHLVHRVGIARRDISLIAPYAAEFFLTKDLLSYLHLFPPSHSNRIQRALLELESYTRISNPKTYYAAEKIRSMLVELAELSENSPKEKRTEATTIIYDMIDMFCYNNSVQIGDRMQGCENEIIILDLCLSNPNAHNFMADYRRLNVLMSRARCSLIIIAGASALLGKDWKMENCETSNPRFTTLSLMEVESLVGKISTHKLNFRAFANSAYNDGYPISVVEAKHLTLGCPRHPDSFYPFVMKEIFETAEEHKQQMLQKQISRTIARPAVAPSPIVNGNAENSPQPERSDEDDQIVDPHSGDRNCYKKCGLLCKRKLHYCKALCHVHAPWFGKFGWRCSELVDYDPVEYGCMHDTVFQFECHLSEEKLHELLCDPQFWPCDQESEVYCFMCGSVMQVVSCFVFKSSPELSQQMCVDCYEQQQLQIAEPYEGEWGSEEAREEWGGVVGHTGYAVEIPRQSGYPPTQPETNEVYREEKMYRDSGESSGDEVDNTEKHKNITEVNKREFLEEEGLREEKKYTFEENVGGLEESVSESESESGYESEEDLDITVVFSFKFYQKCELVCGSTQQPALVTDPESIGALMNGLHTKFQGVDKLQFLCRAEAVEKDLPDNVDTSVSLIGSFPYKEKSIRMHDFNSLFANRKDRLFNTPIVLDPPAEHISGSGQIFLLYDVDVVESSRLCVDCFLQLKEKAEGLVAKGVDLKQSLEDIKALFQLGCNQKNKTVAINGKSVRNKAVQTLDKHASKSTVKILKRGHFEVDQSIKVKEPEETQVIGNGNSGNEVKNVDGGQNHTLPEESETEPNTQRSTETTEQLDTQELECGDTGEDNHLNEVEREKPITNTDGVKRNTEHTEKSEDGLECGETREDSAPNRVDGLEKGKDRNIEEEEEFQEKEESWEDVNWEERLEGLVDEVIGYSEDVVSVVLFSLSHDYSYVGDITRLVLRTIPTSHQDILSQKFDLDAMVGLQEAPEIHNLKMYMNYFLQSKDKIFHPLWQKKCSLLLNLLQNIIERRVFAVQVFSKYNKEWMSAPRVKLAQYRRTKAAEKDFLEGRSTEHASDLVVKLKPFSRVVETSQKGSSVKLVASTSLRVFVSVLLPVDVFSLDSKDFPKIFDFWAEMLEPSPLGCSHFAFILLAKAVLPLRET
eukprot:CAMPEP_0174267192 /NCGR_PEP_ID=MMETSP0439-20130205/32763_1 /TAXON_ID=0 /ORGANISM="Stereomyxa ramosa, Strain Chinc5" /LENGTH=1810 /DNA_ID=CAMNT_0015354553 /DNA_START=1380 /DNA_END=6812 /DNA_ORIENTATION=+